ncbi:MAG: hypothetical protein EB075_07580 [Bacteroidetes bacterium]|nr:hypothetical protein [Bacteroidota bacterium]
MSDRMTNAHFARTNKTFAAACVAAGIEPTSRQAGKFRRGEGIAYRVSNRRANAQKMTCAQLRSALGLKSSDKTRKAALVDLYLAL